MGRSKDKNDFAHRTLPPLYEPLVGSKGQKSTFSEHSHVAYHMQWNDECSNMAANILPFCQQPPTPTPDPGVGSKGQNNDFQNMVMLHIELKGISHATS